MYGKKYNARFDKGLNSFKSYKPRKLYANGGYDDDDNPIEAVGPSNENGIFYSSYLPGIDVVGRQLYPVVTRNFDGDIIGAKFTGERKNFGNTFYPDSQTLVSPEDFSKYRLSLIRQNDVNHTHAFSDAVFNTILGLMGGVDSPLGAIGGLVGAASGEAVDKKLGGNGALGSILGGLVLGGAGAATTSFPIRIIQDVRDNAASMAPELTHFYHGSPVRFDTFSTDFIGSGEGGSKVMRGINLWLEDGIGNAPKFANIKSPDAPLHLGVSSAPLGGELNPTVYDVSGKGLKLYKAAPIEIKKLKQKDLIKQGYDGVQTPNQVTVFPESINKLSIDKQSSIEDFVMNHPEVERWTPWTTDTQKMQNIIDASKMSKRIRRFAEGGRIYIKPSHRGRFTALKERTGHSSTWFKEHGTSAQKKMATFALNAKHWKH